MPMPADVNQHGDIFGGWIMSQVDIAGGVRRGAARARPRRDGGGEFVRVQAAGAGRRPRHVLRGDRPHRADVDHGRRRGLRAAQSRTTVTVKVTEASLTYVAVGADRRPRELPPA